MIIVAINWLFIMFTTYAIGYGLQRMLTGITLLHNVIPQRKNIGLFRARKEKEKRKSSSKQKLRTKPYVIRFRESYLLTGMVAVTIYSEIWSIFGKVGFFAVIELTLLSGIISIEAIMHLKKKGKRLMAGISFKTVLLYGGIFLLMAYFTSHGIEHYDTGLYHAQAIHWSESYGAVKGLGNFNQRLAYNSAVYPLCALYSFSWLLKGYSLHTLAGYFVMLLAWKCLDLKKVFVRGYPTVPDFIRLVAIYYIFTLLDEMVSPASDYFAMTLVLYLVIQWLELDRTHEKGVYPYANLSILAVYGATLKLSIAPFVLLAIRPIVRICHQKKDKKLLQFLSYFFMGLICTVPYLIRNVIISGWLVYPSTLLDFFNVSWKIPKEVAVYDAHEIAVYGRGYTDVAKYNLSVCEWFPIWWNTLGNFNKIMLILDAVGVIGVLIFVIIYLRINKKKKLLVNKIETTIEKKVEKMEKVILLSRHQTVSGKDFLFILFVCVASLVFWFFSAPLVRYGIVFIYLPCALVIGKVFNLLIYLPKLNKKLSKAACVAIVVFLCYKIVAIGMMEIKFIKPENFVKQQDYAVYELNEYEIDGYNFYYPANGDQTGYEPFPSAPVKANVKLYEHNIKKGFYK